MLAQAQLLTVLFYFELSPDLFGRYTYSLVVRLRLLVAAYFAVYGAGKYLS